MQYLLSSIKIHPKENLFFSRKKSSQNNSDSDAGVICGGADASTHTAHWKEAAVKRCRHRVKYINLPIIL